MAYRNSNVKTILQLLLRDFASPIIERSWIIYVTARRSLSLYLEHQCSKHLARFRKIHYVPFSCDRFRAYPPPPLGRQVTQNITKAPNYLSGPYLFHCLFNRAGGHITSDVRRVIPPLATTDLQIGKCVMKLAIRYAHVSSNLFIHNIWKHSIDFRKFSCMYLTIKWSAFGLINIISYNIFLLSVIQLILKQ